MSKWKTGVILAAVFSAVNLALAIVKLYIGLSTNMLAVLTDSYNSFYDFFLGIAVLIALLLCRKEATKKYPNGFGRVEYIVAFAAAIGITALGLSLAYNALARLTYPTPTQFVAHYAYILGGCALVKLALGLIITKLNGKRTLSVRMLALDSFVDVAVAVSTLTAFLLQPVSGLRVDAFFGLGASFFVIFEGVKTMLETGGKLLGKMDFAEKMEQTAKAVEGVFSVKCVEATDYGKTKRAVFVIEIEKGLQKNSLNIKEQITTKVKEEFGFDEVIIDERSLL